MQWIYDLVYGVFDDPASVQLLVVGLAGLTVALLSLGVFYIATGFSDPVRRRLTNLQGGSEAKDSPRAFQINTLLGPITQWVVPSEEIERSKMIEKLTFAGHRAPNALQIFYSIKAILTVSLPAIAYVATYWTPDLDTSKFLFILVGATAVGPAVIRLMTVFEHF
ncbi:MAG: hypothetical protein P8Y69_01000 [Gammaproteobacteria bacterium]